MRHVRLVHRVSQQQQRPLNRSFSLIHCWPSLRVTGSKHPLVQKAAFDHRSLYHLQKIRTPKRNGKTRMHHLFYWRNLQSFSTILNGYKINRLFVCIFSAETAPAAVVFTKVPRLISSDGIEQQQSSSQSIEAPTTPQLSPEYSDLLEALEQVVERLNDIVFKPFL